MILGIISSQAVAPSDDTEPPPSVAVTFDDDNPMTITRSGGNLVATMTADNLYRVIRATFARSTGKYYFEMRRDACTDTAEMSFGFCTASSNIGTFLGDESGAAYSFGHFMDSAVWQGGSQTDADAGVPLANGEWCGIAVDLDARKIWVRDSTGQADSGDPAAGTGHQGTYPSPLALFPAAQFRRTSDQCTANFGDTAFAYAIPSGFTAWSPE